MAERGFVVSCEVDESFLLVSKPGYPDFTRFFDGSAAAALNTLQSSGFLRDLDPIDFQDDLRS